MVKRLTKRIASDWKSPPEFEAEDSNLVDFGDCTLTYVTKARSSSVPAKDLNLKYHAMYIDGILGWSERSAGATRSLSAMTSVRFRRAHRCARFVLVRSSRIREEVTSSRVCSVIECFPFSAARAQCC